MFNVLFTTSLFSPWWKALLTLLDFPSPNLLHAYCPCLVGLSSDSGTPVEMPHQNISYFVKTPSVLVLIKSSPNCCKSWTNILWIRKHRSIFLAFGEVDHGIYILLPAQFCICLEAFLIRNKRLRKWFIIKMISLWPQVTQMQRVVFRVLFGFFLLLEEDNRVMF